MTEKPYPTTIVQISPEVSGGNNSRGGAGLFCRKMFGVDRGLRACGVAGVVVSFDEMRIPFLLKSALVSCLLLSHQFAPSLLSSNPHSGLKLWNLTYSFPVTEQ